MTTHSSEPTEASDAGETARRPSQPGVPPAPRFSTSHLLGGVAVVAVLALQVALLVTVRNTNADVADLRNEVAALAGTATVDPADITQLGSGQSSAAPEVTGSPTGDLPRFLGGGADAALGRNIGDVAGVEYYSGENAVYSPDDGIARAYMVWAHWCPYCQEELPLMSQWQEDNAAALENFEIVSVTSAIDDSAANPLVPYLEESQFPFPVLVDADGRLSRQLGVNAFPFWVFTAPDGTVVGRAAGAIQPEDLDAIFRQLDTLEPVASG